MEGCIEEACNKFKDLFLAAADLYIPSFAEPLTKLFNLSMSSGELLSDWITDNITLVFKKGSKHLYNPFLLDKISSIQK